ncbi:hypothetical protein [Vibrio scophthalmi]|uniref:RstC protein n=1 Tax=Vibrio scophthalmi LMG 19158 TaxID=870967 RepID=F9RIN7_9VIBR|nr:hypothetical protein [Vibrio scophthalmi]EGU42106.1 RstC protein [Vibrio scophthalmi LMG 19158]
MTIREYTLLDVSDSVNELHNIALYLNSGAFTEEIADKVTFLMLERIEELQSNLSFMRLYPELKAEELADNVSNLETQAQTA